MDLALVDQTSEQYLGQWRRLVSTTNWEKGRIIQEWREALIANGTPAIEYSDDAWSRRVGNVTPQHVGRLRRVFDRFGIIREEFPGLFWSHFQACLDWDDAEMWLEDAIQHQWSVSQMRRQRWETLGGSADAKPCDDDIVASELDEDAEPLDGPEHSRPSAIEIDEARHTATVAGGSDAAHDEGSERGAGSSEYEPYGDAAVGANLATGDTPVRPFAGLAELPADVSDAFEAFKLCILRHKLGGWQEISRDDMLGALDALKELALAPATQ